MPAASSVPATGVAVAELSGRTQIFVTPCASVAENANCFPSGEITTGPALNPTERNVVPGGAGMNDITGSAVEVAEGRNIFQASAAARIAKAIASPQGGRAVAAALRRQTSLGRVNRPPYLRRRSESP